MKNVEMKVKDNILTIKIDLSKEQGLSKTGKSMVVATTEGNQPVPGNEAVKIGLNVYTAKETKSQ